MEKHAINKEINLVQKAVWQKRRFNFNIRWHLLLCIPLVFASCLNYIPPTHLKFSHVGDRDVKWSKDINSKDLDKKLNEQYKEKFEKEILNKLGVKWKREKCW